MGSQTITTTCCIVGGGPAGVMLGYLLARAGIDVAVIEKHADFLRDFRGDTIHPSTLEVMGELGLLDAFLKLPHQEVRHLSVQIGKDHLAIAEFDRLPVRCKFIALMPQWDFLDFLAERARAFPNFRLLMQTEAVGLLAGGGRILGVRARNQQGEIEILSALTVAADGRRSVLREAAKLPVKDFGAPMDVLWFRIPRRDTNSSETFGHAEAGRLMVMLNRGDYWQCAYVIRKGSHERLQQQGIEQFRADVVAMAPFLADRIEDIRGWDDVKLLTVKVDRLGRWHKPGLLLIGDAAHAMSPIGGVGINLAVQDAVAAANMLAEPLQQKHVPDEVLDAVQKRRTFPTRITQAGQIFIQKRLVDALLSADKPLKTPGILKLFSAIPLLRTVPAYLVGVGVRPEHVRPEIVAGKGAAPSGRPKA